MKLQEHEAKQLLEKHGLEIPEQGLDEKEKEYVVKAQILANHRKEMGGIKFAKNRKEAEAEKQEMIGGRLDTHEVKNVLVEEQIDFTEEYYVSFMYDTDTRKPAMIFSSEGGTGIEDREAEKLPLKDS
ncbi:MAG: ATP-grasp domain-containing protein, partial [Candidatus Aenigmatarchaeota archaeon]